MTATVEVTFRPTVRVSVPVQALYLFAVPAALLINLRVAGVPIVGMAAAPGLLFAILLASRDTYVLRPLFGFAIAIGLLLAGALVATTAGHGDAAFGFAVPATRNFLFYTVPAVLVMRRPSLRLVILTGWVGLGLVVVFLVGPGLSSLIAAVSRSFTEADVAVLNFYVFRSSADYWNGLLGQLVFPNPGSVKNVIAELSATLLFLVLATCNHDRDSTRQPSRRTTKSADVLALLLAAVVLVSQSRAAWAAIIGSVVVATAGRLGAVRLSRHLGRQLALFVGSVVVIGLVGPITVSRMQDEGTASYDIRPELADFYWNAFLSNPAAGSAAVHPSGLPAHLLVIDWGATAGLFGFSAALMLHVLCLRLIGRARAASPRPTLQSCGMVGLACLPFVRLLTTGGGTWSPAASASLGLAIAATTWIRDR